jgi:hypothetical protein
VPFHDLAHGFRVVPGGLLDEDAVFFVIWYVHCRS